MHTRVLNLQVPNRHRWWLLFGSPVESSWVGVGPGKMQVHRFGPDSLLGLSRQRLNGYGVVDWEVLFLRTVHPGEPAHTIDGVAPGADLILYAHGKSKAKVIQAYLARLDGLGLDPCDGLELHRRAAPYLQVGRLPEMLLQEQGRAS